MGAVFENQTEEVLCDLMCGAPEIEGMTREEAIGWIRALVKTMHEETIGTLHEPEYKDEVYCAIEMAIKALSQEPCKDAISRQAVNNLQKYRYYCGEKAITCVSLASINRLPPINPQPKTGHWINTADPRYSDNIVCDLCGFDSMWEYDFCPKCGAKMVEPQERIDNE